MFLLNLINSFTPRQVFLADAAGAFCTTLILSVGLVQVSHALALEKSTLYFLAIVAALLLTYSFSIYIFKPPAWPIYMKVIAFANGGYCLITWSILFQAQPSLVAWIYFSGETAIVLAIARTEWLYARRYKSRKIDT